MLPMSAIEDPAIAAASPVIVRYLVRSFPISTPAAVALAAVVAASSIPKAVPRTASSAFCMIPSTDSAEWPSPYNLACAVSIPVSLFHPLTKVILPNAVAAPIAGNVIDLVSLSPIPLICFPIELNFVPTFSNLL